MFVKMLGYRPIRLRVIRIVVKFPGGLRVFRIILPVVFELKDTSCLALAIVNIFGGMKNAASVSYSNRLSHLRVSLVSFVISANNFTLDNIVKFLLHIRPIGGDDRLMGGEFFDIVAVSAHERSSSLMR